MPPPPVEPVLVATAAAPQTEDFPPAVAAQPPASSPASASLVRHAVPPAPGPTYSHLNCALITIHAVPVQSQLCICCVYGEFVKISLTWDSVTGTTSIKGVPEKA